MTLKRKSPLRSSGPPERRTEMPRVNRKRKTANTERAYGPPERREFVKLMRCAACETFGYSENAHLLGNGGMSRKGAAKTIGPLCGPRVIFDGIRLTYMKYMGCHALFDEHPSRFRGEFPDFDPEKVAAETEVAWAAHLHQRAGAAT